MGGSPLPVRGSIFLGGRHLLAVEAPTLDSSGMMRGRSINYDIDEIEIDGKVGRGGRSLKVRVHAGPDLIYPGCGIGLRLDGTYVGD